MNFVSVFPTDVGDSIINDTKDNGTELPEVLTSNYFEDTIYHSIIFHDRVRRIEECAFHNGMEFPLQQY